MQERYGLNRSPVGRNIAVGALILAFVAAMVYVTMGLTRDPLETRLVTWTIVSPERLDLSFQVRKPVGSEVTCVIRAQDDRRIDVGYATVTVPAETEQTVIDYRLRTIAPAATVEVLGCSADGTTGLTPPQFPPGVVPPAQPWS